MSHVSWCMSVVQCRADAFCEAVTAIDDARDVLEDDVLSEAPLLNDIPLDVDVA